MANLNFFPFVPGQVVTTDQWNRIFNSIADGSFFSDATAVSASVRSLSLRVTSLELQMAYVRAIQGRQYKREQFVMTAGQTTVNLQNSPKQDSDVYTMNGVNLSKSGYPIGFIGDLTLSGSLITFNPDLSNQIVAGDILVVTYQYEVPVNV